MYAHLIGNLITVRCFVWFELYQCCLQLSHCQCLCEAAVIVGWITAFFVLQICFIPASILGLDCSVLVLAKCVLNYVAFFLLSVTSASSVLSGCSLCFGISQFKLCRSLHALRPSFLRSISLHVISHLSALQCFFNSFTPPSCSLFNSP